MLLYCTQLNFECLITTAELIEHNAVILALVVVQIGFFYGFESLVEFKADDF